MVKTKKRQMAAKPTKAGGPSRRTKSTKEERRAMKLEKRRKEKKAFTADQWREPAPSHLVAKLDIPRVKSKYQSYFEFADNPEKKEKKLEFQVTDKTIPPPGYVFIPIGDPMLTNKCKELSREQDAMIFIVSSWKEEGSKISEHIHRSGYHFRETIVEEARALIGEIVISKPRTAPGFIEPIPEAQEEINRQADGAILDLFPRIPNTDRQMIIEHAFKKGAMFHGEPTVGLQANIPLSRRVQLAVLAHIRHTHTRYDKLLRETTWMNARKAVEPVCLDVLVKWRGDEETGRDQMDEILREVVIITDSEDNDDDSSDDETSDEEGEVTSASSTESSSQPDSRAQERPATRVDQLIQFRQQNGEAVGENAKGKAVISSNTRPRGDPNPQREKKAQRGFKRYQAAWEEALHRRQEPQPSTTAAYPSLHSKNSAASINQPPTHGMAQYTNNQTLMTPSSSSMAQSSRDGQVRYAPISMSTARPDPYYSHPSPASGALMRRNEVNIISQPARPVHYSYTQPRGGTPSYLIKDNGPSQVVRGSPARHDPQDIPLPSVETASSNLASPSTDSHSALHKSYSQLHEPYSRRVVEQRVQSPVPRQVIVIDDDSPKVKRRRMVREDDAVHFGSVSSHDHKFYVSNPARSESHFISAPPAEAANFIVRRPMASSQSTQGLFRQRQPMYIDPATAEELPIVDEPEVGHFARHPIYTRPSEIDYISRDQTDNYGMQRVEPPHHYVNNVRENVLPKRVYAQPDNAQRDRAPQEVSSSGYRGLRHSSPISPQYRAVEPGATGADQDFIQTFSQSRLDGPASHAEHGFIVLSDRSQPSEVGSEIENRRYYESAPARYLPENGFTRARSPVRYLERPLEHRERRPIYHQQPHVTQLRGPNNEPTPLRQYLPPAGGPPTLVRTMERRHQVPVYE